MQAEQLGSAFIAKNWLQLSWIIFKFFLRLKEYESREIDELKQRDTMVKTEVKHLKQRDIGKGWVQFGLLICN